MKINQGEKLRVIYSIINKLYNAWFASFQMLRVTHFTLAYDLRIFSLEICNQRWLPSLTIHTCKYLHFNYYTRNQTWAFCQNCSQEPSSFSWKSVSKTCGMYMCGISPESFIIVQSYTEPFFFPFFLFFNLGWWCKSNVVHLLLTF